MTALNEIFKYNENPITFRKEDGEVFVNATEMAKPFEKRPGKWLELPSTTEFIDTMKAIRKSDRLIETINGVGTWMHEDLALEFARWLSPAFAIWCNNKIKELLKAGYTKLDSISRKDLAKMLFEAEEERERLMSENQQKNLALKEAAPKVLFADAVTASESCILIGELAKILKQRGISIGQNRLFDWLRRNGYLCRRGDSYNLPTQYAMELGLFEIKKTSISQPDGTIFINETTKVTPKGQMYFVNKFLNAA